MAPLTLPSKEVQDAGKMVCTVFSGSKSIILLDFLEPGLTVNSDHYVETLTKLKAQIAHVRPEKREIIHLQHDNTRPLKL